MTRTRVGVGLAVGVGLWPLVYVLTLAPLSRDEVVWITRGAVSEPRWWRWVFGSSHFVGYRPVTALSYSLDSLIGGYAMLPYRATDLLLHAAAAVLVYLVYRRLVPHLSAWGGVAAVGLFVAHPVVGLVVPHLARRSYTLATVLSLLALWTLLGPVRRGAGREVGWLVALVAALLANEAAIVLAPVSVVAAWLHHGPRPAAKVAGLAAAGAVGVLAVRLAVLDGLGGYEVEHGARWGAIFGSTWKSLLGMTVLRSGSPAVPDLLAAAVILLALAGLAVPLVTRRGPVDSPAHRSLVAWVWLGGLALAYLPQGVFFPRQVYLAMPALALLVGVAVAEAAAAAGERRVALLGAVGLVAVGVGWQSPVLRGPDPVQSACWRANDRLVREMAADLAAVPPRTPVHVVAPYYRRPQMEALRAREGDEERMAGRQALTWLAAVHGTRFGKSVLVLAEAGAEVPAASLRDEGGLRVVLAPGAEIAQASDEWRVEGGPEGTVVTPEFPVEEGYLYFHDGLAGRLIAPGGAP